MCGGARSFHGELTLLNISSITGMHGMFKKAMSFTGDSLQTWNVCNVWFIPVPWSVGSAMSAILYPPVASWLWWCMVNFYVCLESVCWHEEEVVGVVFYTELLFSSLQDAQKWNATMNQGLYSSKFNFLYEQQSTKAALARIQGQWCRSECNSAKG